MALDPGRYNSQCYHGLMLYQKAATFPIPCTSLLNFVLRFSACKMQCKMQCLYFVYLCADNKLANNCFFASKLTKYFCKHSAALFVLF